MAETHSPPVIAVRLQLFADLRRFLPKGHTGPIELEMPADATVAELLERAGVPAAEDITVGLNGEQGGRESVLHEGDEVVLFSPMEGG